MIFITGGCGFIGSNFVLDWLKIEKEPILVLDKLNYAGNLNNLESIRWDTRFYFIHDDINNKSLIKSLLEKYQPRAILNFAAESHVDKSIHHPEDFVHTNINGTFCLLEAAKEYWLKLNSKQQSHFRFLQVSTDEVYGSLKANAAPFTEDDTYKPNNPYSATKASADHLVRAYHHTYGLPTLTTLCSNNYGPYQFPEKLIPFILLNALQHKPLFIYGDGMHIRDWLYVSDHCAAIRDVLAKAKIGETYNVGGHNEKTNLDVVNTLCSILDKLKPHSSLSYTSLISHIEDRPGHDRRYAIDASKIQRDIGWAPKESFETGIHKTVSWYLNNMSWVRDLNQTGAFQQWLKTNYVNREST